MDETALHKALIAVQSGLKAPKSQRNTFGNYNYRSCEDILEAVKPLLLANGLTLNLSDEVVCVANRVYIQATATISNGADSTSSTALAREPESKKGMDESQITGTASSYARKYALNGLFCIDDTKDADTDAYQKQQDKQEPKPPQQATAPQKPPQQATAPQKPPALVCADCHAPIVATLINGKKYTAEQVAKASTRDYGEALCYHCKMQRARTDHPGAQPDYDPRAEQEIP